jgi:hypothetical protein
MASALEPAWQMELLSTDTAEVASRVMAAPGKPPLVRVSAIMLF